MSYFQNMAKEFLAQIVAEKPVKFAHLCKQEFYYKAHCLTLQPPPAATLFLYLLPPPDDLLIAESHGQF